MAVSDPHNFLELQLPSLQEKYDELTKTFFLKGKPELKGSLPVRLLDSFLLRSFGLLLGLGKKLPDPEGEYNRLTGNFKRIGKMAKLLGRLGSPGRWMLRMNFGATGRTVIRQGVCGVETRTDHVEAARDYFKIVDLFDMNIEVCGRDDDRIEFKVLECPVGYVCGDDLGVCMATMEFDSQSIGKLGGKSIIKEVIPEGAPACLIHIVPPGS